LVFILLNEDSTAKVHYFQKQHTFKSFFFQKTMKNIILKVV